jgi:hypothetical protein
VKSNKPAAPEQFKISLRCKGSLRPVSRNVSQNCVCPNWRLGHIARCDSAYMAIKLVLLVQHMKFRWFVLSFLFGLLGVVAISLLKIAPLPEFSSSSRPEAAPAAAPAASHHVEAKAASAERAITNALAQIPKGEVYSNVPKEMQVGVSETIEAGITPRVTEQIRKELKGRGDINVESGVRFDPSGTNMELVAQRDEFEVFEAKGGVQFVTANTPGKWIWRVKPLKAGNNLIRIRATVKLNVPKLGVTRLFEVEVFNATREVKVNLAYSIRQFVTTNWKEVLSLVIGSGSLASLATWWIGRKDEKKVGKTEG